MKAAGTVDDDAVAAVAQLEAALDPTAPEATGMDVLAYGEISVALVAPDCPALAGLVAKRMAGFGDESRAARYADLVAEYTARLGALGVPVVPTTVVPVRRPDRGPVVYLLQPLLPAESLGDSLLRTADDAALAEAVTAVLGRVGAVLAANMRSPYDELAVDAQLSNWSISATGPVLLDVGTPFIRRAGRHEFDAEILLSAVPPGIRSWYRRKGTANQYMDDYFAARLVAVDLLGNFVKEGAIDRLPTGLTAVNSWLAGAAADITGEFSGPVTTSEVSEYYRADAATLDLFLRVRRLDRWIRQRLRQPYDFVLPGPVAR